MIDLSKVPTADLFKELIARNKYKLALNVQQVINLVLRDFNISKSFLYKSCSKRGLAEARQVIYYLLRVEYHMTYQSIGGALDRTHATVLYGCKTVEGRLEVDKVFATRIENIRKEIKYVRQKAHNSK